MAIFADIRCLYVGRILARRIGPVVTAGTISRDVHMIKIRRQPADCGVTVLAIVATGDVIQVFARRG